MLCTVIWNSWHLQKLFFQAFARTAEAPQTGETEEPVEKLVEETSVAPAVEEAEAEVQETAGPVLAQETETTEANEGQEEEDHLANSASDSTKSYDINRDPNMNRDHTNDPNIVDRLRSQNRIARHFAESINLDTTPEDDDSSSNARGSVKKVVNNNR